LTFGSVDAGAVIAPAPSFAPPAQFFLLAPGPSGAVGSLFDGVRRRHPGRGTRAMSELVVLDVVGGRAAAAPVR
jgi:hypothetical protein